MAKKIKYLSLFSGIAGFELGIGDRGECVGFSEIDKYAISIYQKHYPTHENYGDITKIDPATLPDFELLVGGFPCQSFSIAGTRGGFQDTRGTLFFDIARILREKRPRLFLLENVKGLCSHDDGRTFRAIVNTLTELGYDLQWQVLNSKHFGVPQNRERIFIVGHTRGERRPKVFPFAGDDSEDIAGTVQATYFKGEHTGTYVAAPRTALTLKARADSGIDEKHPQTVIGTLRKRKGEGRFREIKEGIAPTLNARARQDGDMQPVILQRGRGKNPGGEHALAPTVSSNFYPHNNPVMVASNQRGEVREMPLKGSLTRRQSSKQFSYLKEGMTLRRLTPVECERLQGFPDNWTKYGLNDREISDTQRYKSFMGFGSDSIRGGSGFRSNAWRQYTIPAHDWVHYAEALPALIARMQGVVIENRDYSVVIKQHDSPETFFYVDPPYLHETRTSSKRYKHEMTEADHIQLANQLKRVKGKVLLSCYDSALYRRLYKGWKVHRRRALADGARQRIEVLYANY